MSHSRKVALSWLPAATCMGLLFYLSSLPGDEVKLPDFWMSDKVIHFMAYAGLGCLIASRLYLRNIQSGPHLLNIFRDSGTVGNSSDRLGPIVGILYGASDEIHQMFVPMREASTLDWTADTLGVLAGSWFCHFLVKKYLTAAG